MRRGLVAFGEMFQQRTGGDVGARMDQRQQLQQQLQTIIGQKNQYELAAQEARRAIEELTDVTPDAAVYMTIGTIVVEKPRDEVVEKLQEYL